MGQKVNPNGIRLGIVKPWNSVWYAKSSDYSKFLHKDYLVREYLKNKLKHASVAKIKIERAAKSIKVSIHSARPGIVIGKKGEDVEKIRNKIKQISGYPAQVNIVEIRKPDLSAELVAKGIVAQLEKRVMFRRAMKRAMQNTMRQGAGGIRVNVSGRLGGAEIARTEWYREGRVPLHTFRADIDYYVAEALTIYGIIGVKVWIFTGEKLGHYLDEVATPEKPKKRIAVRPRAPKKDKQSTVAKKA